MAWTTLKTLVLLDFQIEFRKDSQLILEQEPASKIMTEIWLLLHLSSWEVLLVQDSIHRPLQVEMMKIIFSLKVKWFERQQRQNWRSIGTVSLAKSSMSTRTNRRKSTKVCITSWAFLSRMKKRNILIRIQHSMPSHWYSQEANPGSTTSLPKKIRKNGWMPSRKSLGTSLSQITIKWKRL